MLCRDCNTENLKRERIESELFQKKSKSFTWPIKACVFCLTGSLLTPYLTTWLLLILTQLYWISYVSPNCVPAPEMLHLRFPLPGTLFLQMFAGLILRIFFPSITSSEELPWLFQGHPSPLLFISLLYFMLPQSPCHHLKCYVFICLAMDTFC